MQKPSAKHEAELGVSCGRKGGRIEEAEEQKLGHLLITYIMNDRPHLENKSRESQSAHQRGIYVLSLQVWSQLRCECVM